LISLIASADDKFIKVAYSDFPPFEFKKNNQVTGLDAEKVKEVMKRIGYKEKFISYSWEKSLASTKSGEVDAIMSLRKSAQREADFIFADPISVTQNVFFKNKSLNISPKTFDDLKQYNIGTIAGYVYDKNFEDEKFPKLSVMSSADPESHNLKNLANHKLDLAVCDINVSSFLINNNKKFANIGYLESLPIEKVESFYSFFKA